MRQRIISSYPSHGILGEEEGEIVGSNGFQWVLDPIDGTASYVLGLPRFGTLIALLEQRKPRLGVIHLPVTQEILYAETGLGCWYVRGHTSPTQVRVNSYVGNLKHATVSLSGVDCSELRKGMRKQNCLLGGLILNAGCLEFVGDCIQHMLVARGSLHVALDSIMQPWDSAAIIPCISEAGGVVSTIQGEYDNVVFGGSLLSSCCPQLHEEVLGMINGRYVQ
jgi:histidinol-phosphatase